MSRYGQRTRVGTAVSTFGTTAVSGVSYGVATGGTSSSITDGGQAYTLLSFTSDGTLTVSTAGLFEVLILGGGSGGGREPAGSGRAGGGGGGGGILQETIYLTATTYSVTVGSGGAGSATDNLNGSFGTMSFIGDFAAGFGGDGDAQGTVGGCRGAGIGLRQNGRHSGQQTEKDRRSRHLPSHCPVSHRRVR